MMSPTHAPTSLAASINPPSPDGQPVPSLDMPRSRTSLSSLSLMSSQADTRPSIRGLARHTLGLVLLLVVVFLWTASNFLGSSIFADNSYAKPFFLTYLNTSFFILPLIPVLIRSAYKKHRDGELRSSLRRTFTLRSPSSDETHAFLKPANDPPSTPTHLGIGLTARLSFAFCILWFLANYFAMSCLQYTTVASATILTSTSSIWTLVIGAFTGTEKFTYRKLLGVLGSLVGIVLISRIDLTSDKKSPAASVATLLAREATESRSIGGSFPDKPARELFLGDILAALSALIYGIYTITLKKTTISAAPLQLNMPLFFGLVGLFNTLLLWPLFPLLSFTRIEPFQLPPSRRIWTILLVNSVSSLLSDICWAYAMLLTSPLVVTVGLSLTIPLSLVGEMVVQGRTEGWVYWVGAFIVVSSFVFVDREEVKDEVEEDEEEEGEEGDDPHFAGSGRGEGDRGGTGPILAQYVSVAQDDTNRSSEDLQK